LSNKEIKDKRAAMIGEDAEIKTEIIQEIIARKESLIEAVKLGRHES
jgi:hypothetical protein